MRVRPRQLGLLLLAWAFVPQAWAQAPESVSFHLQRMLDRPASRDRDSIERLRALYKGQRYAPLWQGPGKPTTQARELVRLLLDAGTYGLRPSDYDADRVDAEMQNLLVARDAPAARRAEFDLLVSASALRFVRHLHYGRVDPRAAGFELYTPRSDLDEPGVIRRLALGRRPEAVLETIEPPFGHYRLLRSALGRYRQLASDPGLTALPRFGGGAVKPGGRYAGAAALRRLLVALGDLDSGAANESDVIDESLTAALQRFQRRHGLSADGILGPRTYAALTIPLAERVRQIELTLERWRWLRPFATPPIVVNLPAFRLYAFRATEDRESEMLKMDVIVGQSYPETQTPVFFAEMKYVVFRPYWDVPDTILQREMLPAIRDNPRFLSSNHMELVRGWGDEPTVVPATPENIEALAAGGLRLRQQPGPHNALGAIKFVLPNYHSVYLHSTPTGHLFGETRRDLSHGCIRVGDPAGLAAHVLRNAADGWNEDRIREAMNGPPNQRVNLVRPIPVMILYATAMATESGQMLFFDDIYGHDQKLDELLRARRG
ncbi:MAG TPA: L,D-transpeptidase family protein [Burkholderiales bacterium]|nr:L,D-transpeptidase family protein [Burkholderiales bacterium]HYA46249.1 L,D-transpeptidase family protein [Burkholderiales bacterium]